MIEQKLEELTAAVKALTAVMQAGAGQQAPAPTPKPKPEKQAGEAQATGGGATLSPEQVSEASDLIKQANPLVNDIVGAGKKEEAVALLAKYGAKKTSGVPVDKLPAFLAELKKLHAAATAVDTGGDDLV